MPVTTKKKFELEFSMNTSPKLLFPRLSTPGGLSEWFADNVMIRGNIYSFVWDGNIQKAEQKYIRENQVVRYEWLEDKGNTYFEFRLKTDELTGELALIVTDFADSDEKEDVEDLWDSQITRLKHCIGL
jgi:uncharacterized protein YndB with AHSA1/START domain